MSFKQFLYIMISYDTVLFLIKLSTHMRIMCSDRDLYNRARFERLEIQCRTTPYDRWRFACQYFVLSQEPQVD